jgi:chromosome segregation ATPase
MATTGKIESASPRASLRERLRQDSEQLSVLASAETVEKLTTLLQSLTETSERLVHALDETADRSVSRLREIADSVRQSGQETTAAATRLADLQQSVNDAERNLTYQVERLKRQADRAQWMQTGVVLLALAAGILGGIAATLVMLKWTP